MSEFKPAKGSAEWQMFSEFWKIYCHYYYPEDKKEYWENLLHDMGELSKKFTSKFNNALLVALFDELERRYKRKEGMKT